MRQEKAAPDDPTRVLDATLARIEAEPMDMYAYAYVTAATGEATPAQRARMKALMDGGDSDRAMYAGMLWDRTTRGPERAALLDWVRARVEDHALHGAPRDVLGAYAIVPTLDASEHATLCDHSKTLMEHPGASPEALGNIAWELWDTKGGCVDVVVWALEHDANLPAQAVRGAIRAYDDTNDQTDLRARYLPHADSLSKSLRRLLGDVRPNLRAEAARALRGLPKSVDALRAALESEPDAEVQRSILIGLNDSPDPGPPDLFIRVLRDGPHTSRVERRLHSEIARSGDPKAITTGLALATSPNAYDAYHWRVVYRTDTLSEAILDQLAADAFGRLRHLDSRTRQSACHLLTKHPHLEGEVRELERVAQEDDTPYVRDACARAARVMRATIGPT